MFRLAHISDPHLTAIPQLRPAHLLSKRLFGFYNWYRNRRLQFGPANLSALVDHIHAERPDHIAVTGDLVNLGLEAEFEAAHAWLTGLGDPEIATVVPGNHDVYMPDSWVEMSRHWGKYMLGDGAVGDAVAFPFVRRRGPVALVGVSSAVATGPMFATGMIGTAQAARLADTLGGLAEEKCFRVVLVHHSPVEGSTTWRRRFVDAKVFRAAIAKAGAELVLHGHNHRTVVDAIPGPGAPVPVVGVAAASVLPVGGRAGGSYCMFAIDGGEGRFSCRMTEHALTSMDGKVETIREESLA